MKVQPLISVIIPIYNIEDCLPRCVASVQNQTYQNLEILLVDDGSTDGTGALCDALAAKDARIRVFHKENGGSSSARNMGIREARGEYLGFVDSDDWIEPEMYEALLTMIQERGLGMAQASRDEIDEEGMRRPDVCTPPERETEMNADCFLRELLLHRGDCSFCTKLIKKELFAGRQFPEGKLNEDFYLLVQMLPDAGKVGILPQQYYHVFYRIGSNTRKKDKNDFSRVYVDIVDNADFTEELVRKNYPNLKNEAVRFALFQRLDYMLHIPVSQMRRDNAFYVSVKKYLRAHTAETVRSVYLTKKNKIYLLLLTLAPKTVRKIHGFKMAAVAKQD